jgi:FkbM family methyltransferase
MYDSAEQQDNNIKAFLYRVLGRFLADMHHIEQNNFNTERYASDAVDRSMVFESARHARSLDNFISCQDLFFQAWSLFEDNDSKNLFVDLLRYQLSGHLHVRLPTNNPTFHEQSVRLKQLSAPPTSVDVQDVSQSVRHYEFEYDGHKLVIDGYESCITWPLFHRQYFFERTGVRICPELNDHVVDAGACMGETAIIFGQAVGPDGWIYAFDPLESHLKFCRHNFEQNTALAHFTLFNKGLSNTVHDSDKHSTQPTSIQPSFSILDQNNDIPTTTLDHLVSIGQIPHIDFIKMDIEGSEINALQGSVDTLRRFRPKLAISVYHVLNHYFEAILFLHSLNLGYKFYLDHYTIHHEETVLYAIAA